MTLSAEEATALDAVASQVDTILSEGAVDAADETVIAAIPRYAGADENVREAVKSVYKTTALALIRAGLVEL